MKDFDQGYEVKDVVRDAETGEPVRNAKGDVVTTTYTVVRNSRLTRDRSFVIGGETFTFRPAVAPETILDWSRMVAGEIELKEQEALRVYDDTIIAFLEPGQEAKWNQVRDANVANPLNLGDLSALIRWLLEEQSGRPTSPPSGSTSGPGGQTSGTSSTVGSSSPVAPASQS